MVLRLKRADVHDASFSIFVPAFHMRGPKSSRRAIGNPFTDVGRLSDTAVNQETAVKDSLFGTVMVTSSMSTSCLGIQSARVCHHTHPATCGPYSARQQHLGSSSLCRAPQMHKTYHGQSLKFSCTHAQQKRSRLVLARAEISYVMVHQTHDFQPAYSLLTSASKSLEKLPRFRQSSSMNCGATCMTATFC